MIVAFEGFDGTGKSTQLKKNEPQEQCRQCQKWVKNPCQSYQESQDKPCENANIAFMETHNESVPMIVKKGEYS
jgi:hypothetical protein